jgi:uncharacterized protein HemX
MRNMDMGKKIIKRSKEMEEQNSRSNKKKLPLIIAVVVLAIIGIGGWRYQQHQQKQEQQRQTQVAAAAEAAKTVEYVTYKGITGQTALDILKSQHKVSVKVYSFGDLVESIDGVSGAGPKYWTFYVNGKMADMGAGSYQSQPTDKIEWKLEQQ